MFTVIAGPPGTGKTLTISTASRIWSDHLQCSVWICAQSNIVVKNIAESLHRFDVYFKLIVSSEFYVEWLVLLRSINFQCSLVRLGTNIYTKLLDANSFVPIRSLLKDPT